MSHSVDPMQKSIQKYIDLYRLNQSSVAKALHSDFAQSVVAAKNFAVAITKLDSNDENLKEVHKLAGFIIELTDQAYTVAYDLMRQNQTYISSDTGDSIQSVIEQYGFLLRFNDLGVKLQISEHVSLDSVDCFVQAFIVDWIKAIFIYLIRHTDASNITIDSCVSNTCLNLKVTSNIVASASELEVEPVFVNMHKQLDVLSGCFSIKCGTTQCSMNIEIPFDSDMENLSK